MADEYIRLEDAINTAYELYEETDFIKAEELSAFVKSIPAADVRPVVRCRECKHYNAGLECLIDGYGIERPADYFCADGKRKGGDGE